MPLSAKGELTCPRAVVAARAFVAKLKPVRDLRPQALPVKVNRGMAACGRTVWWSQAEICAARRGSHTACAVKINSEGRYAAAAHLQNSC